MAPGVREKFIAVWLFLGLVAAAGSAWFVVVTFSEHQRARALVPPTVNELSNEVLLAQLAGEQYPCEQVLNGGPAGLVAHVRLDERQRRITVVCVER